MADNNNNMLPSEEPKGNVVIYTSEDGRIRLDVQIGGETVWLTLEQMATLFGRDATTIGRHIKNIYAEGELAADATTAKFAVVVKRGFRGEVPEMLDHYNLDVIISVGYRVHSIQGVRFRQWATGVLREFIVKGFALDDERLKQSIEFFKIVQNKLHFAAHGHTAAEVIYDRADADRDFMGMTSFKGKWPTLRDAQIAKNYLSENELLILNKLVSGYFDFAEVRALRQIPTYMSDYIEQLDNVLAAGGNPLLADSGTVSHEDAMLKAETEYRKWQQNTLSPVEEAYLESIKMIGKKGKK